MTNPYLKFLISRDINHLKPYVHPNALVSVKQLMDLMNSKEFPSPSLCHNLLEKVEHNDSEALSAVKSLDESGFLFSCARELAISIWGYSIPTEYVVRQLAQLGPIVDVFAGAGYWSKLFRSVGNNTVAIDNSRSWKHTHTNIYYANAEKVIHKYSNRVLFMSWPPYNDSVGYNCLKNYLDAGGKTFVYIGEGEGGCTGDDQFHSLLESSFPEPKTLYIPSWPGIHDMVYIYSK